MAQPKSNRQLAKAYAANFRDETSHGRFGNMSYSGRLAYSWVTVIINQQDTLRLEHSERFSNSTASQRAEYIMALVSILRASLSLTPSGPTASITTPI
jgi:hypothetical protein